MKTTTNPTAEPVVRVSTTPRTMRGIGSGEHDSMPPAGAAVHQYEAVRERLSERRRELGMSMSALARKIGVTPSMISQIERGQSLPSVETLFALAEALGATVDTFFGSPDHVAEGRSASKRPSGRARAAAGATAGADPYFVGKEDRTAISIEGGVRWERLTPRAMVDFDFLELIYAPGAQSSEHLYPHPGFEMVLVISGRMEIYVGFEHYVLDPGDSIAFSSSVPHRYVNPLDQESRAVTTIIHEPVVAAGSVTHAAPMPRVAGVADAAATRASRGARS